MLPAGADETVAEAGGAVLLAGSGLAEARQGLTSAERLWTLPTVTTPGALVAALVPLLGPVHALLLPASPDGRDLAPRLAAALRRPLLAGALEVLPYGADVLRWDGAALVELSVDGPFVATLEPGLRGAEPALEPVQLTELSTTPAEAPTEPTTDDIRRITLRTHTGATDDADALPHARHVLGAGAGLGDRQTVDLLVEVGRALDFAVGGTRVVTDAGWLDHARQIGTTGVAVSPDIYVAFGVSGALHHTGGLGTPRRVISVNTDPYCPMTAMADLGIVADAADVLAALAALAARTDATDATDATDGADPADGAVPAEPPDSADRAQLAAPTPQLEDPHDVNDS